LEELVATEVLLLHGEDGILELEVEDCLPMGLVFQVVHQVMERTIILA
jgi:hypothetical protein